MIGRAGRKSEKLLLRKLGARATPNSGAVEGAKGDGSFGDVLLEAKSSTGRTIPVEHAWLSKIAKEARDIGKRPMLALSFTNGEGRPVPAGEWVCMPLNDYHRLKEQADANATGVDGQS